MPAPLYPPMMRPDFQASRENMLPEQGAQEADHAYYQDLTPQPYDYVRPMGYTPNDHPAWQPSPRGNYFDSNVGSRRASSIVEHSGMTTPYANGYGYALSEEGGSSKGNSPKATPKKLSRLSYIKSTPAESSQGHDIEMLPRPHAINSKELNKMKYGRLRHVDGFRFLAAMAVLTSTVIGTTSAEWSLGNSVLHPFNSNFGLMLFLAISGRTIGINWLLSREDAAKAKAKPSADASADEKKYLQLSQSSPPKRNKTDFQTIGLAMMFRPFRFVLPILVVTGNQYGICRATSGYPDNVNFQTLIGGRPSWCFSSPSQWIATATNLFTVENMPLALRNSTGALWTMPWAFQNSFYIYSLVLVISNLQKDARLFLMALLCAFSWASLSYICPAILGLMVVELQVSGRFAKVTGVWRYAMQLLVGGVALVLLMVPEVRDPVNKGFASIQTLKGNGSHMNALDSNIYGDVTICYVFASALLLAFIELSTVSQKVLGFAPLAVLGQQLSTAMVAIHSLVLWSLMPKIFALTSATATVGGEATKNLGLIWTATFFITLCLSVAFRALVEIPSELLGRTFLIAFFGKEQISQLSTNSSEKVEQAKASGYFLPRPTLGNPLLKLGLAKVPGLSA